jgi:hypothetical protein
MSKEIQNEKKNLILLKFGDNLKQLRTLVSKSDISDFIVKINNFSNIIFTEDIILQMEEGKPVSIEYWIYIWMYFQNIEKIIAAYDIKEMIYLAKQEFVNNIEEEILNYHKDKNNAKR